MDNFFLNKIKQTISDHLDDEKFGVGELASEVGLSKSQTFRKVKSLTGKSISQIIKETRLQKAAKLLLESDLHASEISYKVGFTSPSYFNKCFHNYYGITPGDYKENGHEIYLKNPFDQKSSRSKIKKFQFIFIFLAITLIVILLNVFFNNKNLSSNTVPNNKSIAVLFFDDNTSESNQEWFCSAIAEEIRSKLSNIKRLKVTSSTSVKQFRNNERTIPEIAEALDVDYILEGSITKYNNKIKIIAQLINANDEHIWSKEYNDDMGDIFAIQQNVAKDIAQQLNIDLGQDEEKSIAYNPTENLEAFQLFFKGVSLADSRTKEGLATSVKLFQKAIDLDPNFAEAYAELAATYRLIYVYRKFKNEITYKKINALLDKSLEINPNTVRAYTTKGMIYMSHKNWLKAKENYEIALALNSNDATLHHYYALYFSDKPKSDYKKALEHTNIAQKLNPYSFAINLNKITFLLENDKIDEAEEFYQQNNSIFTEKMKLSMRLSFIIYKAKTRSIEKKDWKEAIKFYHKAIEDYPKNIGIYSVLAMSYNEILNDAQNYLKYAKIAYKLDSVNRKNAYVYFHSLLKNKKIIEYKKLLQNDNFNSLFIEKEKVWFLFYRYYKQENYKKAQEKLDKYKYESHFEYSINLAQQNKVKEAYEIINRGVLKNYEKAIVFAILKEKDSMYHYINRENNIYNVLRFNGFKEVDPYRKEVRFKKLLKKHYLPITNWNK